MLDTNITGDKQRTVITCWYLDPDKHGGLVLCWAVYTARDFSVVTGETGVRISRHALERCLQEFNATGLGELREFFRRQSVHILHTHEEGRRGEIRSCGEHGLSIWQMDEQNCTMTTFIRGDKLTGKKLQGWEQCVAALT